MVEIRCVVWGELFKANKFHIENEGGVGRDDSGVTLLAVGIVWSAGQLGTLTDRHLENTIY